MVMFEFASEYWTSFPPVTQTWSIDDGIMKSHNLLRLTIVENGEVLTPEQAYGLTVFIRNRDIQVNQPFEPDCFVGWLTNQTVGHPLRPASPKRLAGRIAATRKGRRTQTVALQQTAALVSSRQPQSYSFSISGAAEGSGTSKSR